MSAHPDITRTAVTRRCEACEGGGVLVVNDTNPHGYGPDPQRDEEVDCAACGGSGELTEWLDPLLVLRSARRRRRIGFVGRMEYANALQSASVRVHLDRLELLAEADRSAASIRQTRDMLAQAWAA